MTTTNTMNEMIAAATAMEKAHVAATRAWVKGGRVGEYPNRTIASIATGTIAGHAVECRATMGGNTRAQHIAIRWKLDGKMAAAAVIAAL